jgi:hypothetical protein
VATVNALQTVVPELTFLQPGTCDIELELGEIIYQKVDNRVECHFEIWTSVFKKGTAKGQLTLKTNIPETTGQGLYGPLFRWDGLILPKGYTYVGVMSEGLTDQEGKACLHFWMSGSRVPSKAIRAQDLQDGIRLELMGTASWWTESLTPAGPYPFD